MAVCSVNFLKIVISWCDDYLLVCKNSQSMPVAVDVLILGDVSSLFLHWQNFIVRLSEISVCLQESLVDYGSLNLSNFSLQILAMR